MKVCRAQMSLKKVSSFFFFSSRDLITVNESLSSLYFYFLITFILVDYSGSGKSSQDWLEISYGAPGG